MTDYDLLRRLVAEMLGTALLLATVVGSGIMGVELAAGVTGLALLGNTIATGAILVVLILIFGPVSGAHFNPAVTLAFLIRREIAGADAAAYVAAQAIGALAGVAAAHLMFEAAVFTPSTTVRTGGGQWFAEGVATFGLVATILGCLRFRREAVPYAVGLFITAGYWFTASTSFANPAVTVGRALTDTFSGIRPLDVPGFVVAQAAGAVLATALMGWLLAPRVRPVRQAKLAGQPAE
ncbi:MAG: MIP/aquaporin family protein [Azospirillaceae bacterium]